jgi:uncharacterized protein
LPVESCELLRRSAGGIRIRIRLRPAGGGDRIEGIGRTADGSARLEARVSAPPEGGKANRALLKLLAKAWRLPAGDLALVAGAKARDKVVEVRGPSAELEARLGAWAAALEGRTA